MCEDMRIARPLGDEARWEKPRRFWSVCSNIVAGTGSLQQPLTRWCGNHILMHLKIETEKENESGYRSCDCTFPLPS